MKKITMPKARKAHALSILLISSAIPISANTRLCEITGIHDGDSLRVSCHQKALRLACIDAPEPDQPFGQEATDYLASLTLGKELEVVNRGDGGFSRTASIIYVNNVNIQERLLSAGLAWYYPQYASKCGDFMGLKQAEQSAKDRGAGLWKSANPISRSERVAIASPNEYLFPGRAGDKPLTRAYTDLALRQACDRLGFKGISTHSFRRTALTRMHAAGVPLRTIQKISGHSSLGTLALYLEVTDENVRDAVGFI